MSDRSENTRIETFCDGVFAIAITLLILEIKIPAINSIHSVKGFWLTLLDDWPSWFAFLLSFYIILIAWVNHHGCFKLIDKSNPQFIYANGFMLLTVVVIPFSAALMAEYIKTDFAQPAISFYCFGILLHNISWVILGWTIMHPVPLTRDAQSQKQLISAVIKNSHYAFFIYLSICILSFWFPTTAMVLMTTSWLAWLLTSILLVPKNQKS